MSSTTTATTAPILDSFGLSPSVYGAEAAALSLADSFLAPGTYSTLRSGFLGYQTGVMARAMAEGAYHRNVLYKEEFLNTCSLPDSVYNFAKQYEVTPALATPSSCTVLLGFYVSALQAAIGSASGSFAIPRGQAVMLGSTPFVVAGEVDFTLGQTDTGAAVVSASFNLSNMDFPEVGGVPLQAALRTYVLDQATGASGATQQAAYAEVTIVQAQVVPTSFTVTQSGALEALYYDVPAPASPLMLAGFTVSYRPPGAPAAAQLPVYFNESVVPPEAEYAYYTYAGGQDLEVYFSPLAGQFQPAYNSTLTVSTLQTLGSGGNFDFSGSVSVTLPSPYRSLAVLTELVTQPAGGADQQTLLELKQAVQSAVVTRNSIVTETDLEKYLAGAVAAAAVNGTTVQFVKRRDDIIRRTFNGFLTMRDSAGRVVPTNSADLSLEVADLDAAGWSLKPGTVVIYDRANRIFRLLEPGEYPDQMVGDPSNFVYAVPYLMAFFVQPYPRLAYFNNSADVDQAVSQAPGPYLTSDSFLASSLTVQRNAATSSSYQLDFALTTSLQSSSDVAAKCQLRAILSDPSSGAQLGFVPLSCVAGTSVFRALLSTDDSFSAASQLYITSSLYDMNTGDLLAAVPVPQSLDVEVELYYNTGNSSTQAGSTISLSGTVYQLVYTWETQAAVSLYQSLEQVADGELHVDTSGVFHAGAVPLVGANYFLNPRLGSAALAVAQQYQQAVVAAFAELANNTSVSIKYANTYGPSRLYNVDRTNLSIALGVGTGVGGTPAIRAAVVAAVAEFVEGTNSNAGGRFSVSNLITYLETNVSGVVYVQSVTVNGVPTQNVQMLLGQDQLQQDNRLVPEFLNAGTVLTSNLAADPYQPDVTVTFVS